MDTMTIIGVCISLFSLIGLAAWTGLQKKRNTSDTMSPALVFGLLMGSSVGGSATVGTAQLAFNYGMSAWWFTLGGGIGCFLLGLAFYEPLKHSGSKTLVGIVAKEYGPKAGLSATILNSLGMFINILSQLLACSAVVLVIAPHLNPLLTIAAGAVFMLIYILSGGTKGAGIVGILKTCLLIFAMAVCGFLAVSFMGGIGGTVHTIQNLSTELGRNLFSPFNRGLGTDLGAGLSLVLGIITTQTYAQGVLYARNAKDAKLCTLGCGFMIPAIGVLGILVGLYMRTAVPDPSTFVTRTALTSFILQYSGMPKLLAGIILGALFISSVGTGAGLALGIATVLDRELVAKKKPDRNSEKSVNLLITLVILLGMIMVCTPIGDAILSFAFLSMCLRGCTVFAPLCFALWAKGKVPSAYAFASIVGGSLTALFLGVMNMYHFIKLPCDAVFFGVGIGLAIMAAGYLKSPTNAR